MKKQIPSDRLGTRKLRSSPALGMPRGCRRYKNKRGSPDLVGTSSDRRYTEKEHSQEWRSTKTKMPG